MAERSDDERARASAPSPDGWSLHEEAQRRAWQRTTARERLAWLEDAKRFVARVRAATGTGADREREGA